MKNWMWKYRLCLMTFFAAVTVVGCVGFNALQVNLDDEFTLSIGQRAVIKGEELQVLFQEITGDSRCPADVNCIWQGEVTCNIEITYKGNSSQIALTQPGLSDEYAVTQYQGYKFSIKVTPYPRSGQKITPDMYRLHMIVSKLPD